MLFAICISKNSDGAFPDPEQCIAVGTIATKAVGLNSALLESLGLEGKVNRSPIDVLLECGNEFIFI